MRHEIAFHQYIPNKPCKSFGKCIKSHFNKGTGKVRVSHWSCCLENHKNGGQHSHVSLKLSGPKRWINVKNDIQAKHGIVVNTTTIILRINIYVNQMQRYITAQIIQNYRMYHLQQQRSPHKPIDFRETKRKNVNKETGNPEKKSKIKTLSNY